MTPKFYNFFLAILFVAGTVTMSYGQTVIWSEDFDGGIPVDWDTSGGIQLAVNGDTIFGVTWEWDADGSITGLSGVTSGADIASPTVGNGVMVFNGDFAITGGTVNPGNPPYPENKASLTSPNIDLSMATEVSVKFHQSFAGLNGNAPTELGALFSYSIDGGLSYSDPVPVNDDLATSENSPPGDFKVFNLPGAGGSSEVRLRWSFDGDFYYWMLDDIDIISKPNNDLALGEYVFYTPASFRQPITQIASDTMIFQAEVTNNGAVGQVNATLRATITDDNNAVIYQDSFVAEVLDVGVTDSLFDAPGFFVPDNLDLGVYTITYELYNPDSMDFNPTDNTWTEDFEVTSNLFAKENDSSPTGIRASGAAANGDYIMGNFYRAATTLLDDYQVTNVSFSVAAPSGSSLNGRSVDIYLVKVNDDVDPGFNNFDDQNGIASSSLTLLGAVTHDFTNEANYQIVTKQLDPLADPTDLHLEPGGRYFAVVSYDPDNWDLFMGVSSDINYWQISTIVYASSNGAYQWFLGGFGEDLSALVRMEIDLISSVDLEPLPETAFSVFPNPTTDFVNVDLNFDQPTKADVTLANMDGKVILIDEINDVTSLTRSYNTSELAAGTYILRVATENGTKTRKFVVQRK